MFRKGVTDQNAAEDELADNMKFVKSIGKLMLGDLLACCGYEPSDLKKMQKKDPTILLKLFLYHYDVFANLKHNIQSKEVFKLTFKQWGRNIGMGEAENLPLPPRATQKSFIIDQHRLRETEGGRGNNDTKRKATTKAQ